MECPVCKNEFVSETGRRPKKFCSDTCKINFWNAMKKVKQNNKSENKKKIEEKRNRSNKLSEKMVYPLTTEECYDGKELKNYTADEIGQTQKPTIPPMPIRKPGEDALDYAQRKNEWKRLFNQ